MYAWVLEVDHALAGCFRRGDESFMFGGLFEKSARPRSAGHCAAEGRDELRRDGDKKHVLRDHTDSAHGRGSHISNEPGELDTVWDASRYGSSA